MRPLRILLPVLAVLGALPAAAAPREVPVYRLLGRAKVLQAQPFNPVPKDRMHARFLVRVATDARGPYLDVWMPRYPEHCRFDLPRLATGRPLALSAAAECPFEALGSPGGIRLSRGRATFDGAWLRVEAVVFVWWTGYRGTVEFDVRGTPEP